MTDYAIRCDRGTVPLPRTRVMWRPYRWMLAHLTAWSANRDVTFGQRYWCGRHRVIPATPERMGA